MVIDTHQHFWVYDPVRDNWIDDSMKTIRRDFLPKHLKPILKINKVDGCIAVQADQSIEETKFLLNLAKENSFIKGVVGWVDLTSKELEKQLSSLSKNGHLKGVRHILQAEKNDFVLREDFQKGIGKLKQFNLTYDLLIFPSQIPAAIQLIQKFPKQKFILNHIAKPNIKKKEILEWKHQIQEMAKAPNIFCKVSGMVTENNWKDWNITDFTPYLDVVFEAFGIDRIMYGSDWPVCLLAAQYMQQMNIIENYIFKFTENEKEKILCNNAISIYNL
jgi:L-fuconolactonase